MRGERNEEIYRWNFDWRDSEGYNERAFVSMNKQLVERLEIDDGNVVEFFRNPL